MLTWNAATMSTGVADIDEQHQELIKKLNELMANMHQGTGREALRERMEFLADYAAWHFKHEERCMDAYRCPAAAVNKQAHADFIRTFASLKERVEREGATTLLVIETQQQLSDWLRSHIVKVDTQMKSCVKRAPQPA